MVKFSAKGSEIDQLSALIPSHAHEEDGMREAGDLLNLLARMSEDGKRATIELATDLLDDKGRLEARRSEVDAGQSFAERDLARQEVRELAGNFDRKRHLCVALMVEQGISVRELAAQMSIDRLGLVETLGTASKHNHQNRESNNHTDLHQGSSNKKTSFWVGGAIMGLAAAAFVSQLASKRDEPPPASQAPSSIDAPERTQTPSPAGPPVVSNGNGDDFHTLADWKKAVTDKIREQISQSSWEGNGRVVVSFTAFPDGSVRFVTPARRSGDNSLDLAAVQAVNRAAPLPRPPDGSSHQVTVPISFGG